MIKKNHSEETYHDGHNHGNRDKPPVGTRLPLLHRVKLEKN